MAPRCSCPSPVLGPAVQLHLKELRDEAWGVQARQPSELLVEESIEELLFTIRCAAYQPASQVLSHSPAQLLSSSMPKGPDIKYMFRNLGGDQGMIDELQFTSGVRRARVTEPRTGGGASELLDTGKQGQSNGRGIAAVVYSDGSRGVLIKGLCAVDV